MPEPTEAMVEALFRATEGHAMPSWNVMRDALEAALAVSPGCRGAELADALEQATAALRENVITWIALEKYLDQPYPDDPRWTPWTRFGKRAFDKAGKALTVAREALAAVRASGEAGPDPLAERVKELEGVLRRVRTDIARRLAGDDAIDAPFDEDLSEAARAIHEALSGGVVG